MKSSSQWEDLVYEAALKIQDPAGRKVFLDQACVDDPALRASVEEMLGNEAAAEQLFNRGSRAMQITAESFQGRNGGHALEGDNRVQLPEDEKLGARIGRYKLLEKIGEGGCGSVYLADQEDPVRRSVALKIVKLGMDTKSLIARFEAERQALALMDHPNIARALDAGATETGRPFFVMELVRGDKITLYCDEHKLNIHRRLELFIQICHAVQHAHQKGIIHRDLKPSNILVTEINGSPVPKVIDFGIAKAITGERLANNTVFTANEQFLGTPAYMSPEQAQMGRMDIDTRTDIYSLGVLLYELLTWYTPLDGKKLMEAGVEELQRALRETEPSRPSVMLADLPEADRAAVAESRAIDPDRLVGQVRGDLDWIVMKALEKDRARRYATAHEMALDIQRCLRGDVVLASPPGRIYLLQKLIRRNKAAFAAAAAVAGALLLGLGTSTYLFFQEREAHRQAEWEKIQERQLNEKNEAASNIAEAALDIEVGKFDDAAAAVLKISPDFYSPTLQSHAQVYRSIANNYASNQKWKEAALFYRNLLHVTAHRDTNPSAARWDLLSGGVALVEMSSDHRNLPYQQFRAEALRRVVNGGDALGAERFLRATLLMAASPEFLQSLSGKAQTVQRSFSEPEFSNVATNSEAPWRWVALGLLEYRQGQWAKAAERCANLAEDTNPARHAVARLVFALSEQRLGQTAVALAAVQEVRPLVDDRFHDKLEMGDAVEGYWFDWAMARILLREATTTIKAASSGH